MPVALRVEIDTGEVQRLLTRLNLQQGPGRAAVERSLDRMAFLVQTNAADTQIIRGGARGAPPHPTRLTNRTNTLRGSIRVNRSRFRRAIGTDKVYGEVHEFGGRFHPRRPFLAPALAETSERFDDILAEEIQRLIDG